MTEDNYREKYDAIKTHYWVPIWISCIALAAVFALFLVLTVEDSNQFGIAIGVLQFLLAVTALAGFWTIRNAAKDSARAKEKQIADEVTKERLKNAEEIIRAQVNLKLTEFLQTKEAELLIREQVRQLGLAKFIPPRAVEKAKSANISELKPNLPAIPTGPDTVDWNNKKLDKTMTATFKIPNHDGEKWDG